VKFFLCFQFFFVGTVLRDGSQKLNVFVEIGQSTIKAGLRSGMFHNFNSLFGGFLLFFLGLFAGASLTM
jgi:hypothetical protein